MARQEVQAPESLSKIEGVGIHSSVNGVGGRLPLAGLNDPIHNVGKGTEPESSIPSSATPQLFARDLSELSRVRSGLEVGTCHQEARTDRPSACPTHCLAKSSALSTLQVFPIRVTQTPGVRLHFGTWWPSALRPGPGQTEPVSPREARDPAAHCRSWSSPYLELGRN